LLMDERNKPRACAHCQAPLTAKKKSVRFCSLRCANLAEPRRNPRGSLADRFWSRVNKSGPIVQPTLGACWIWTAGLSTAGYGKIATGNGSTSVYSHRVSWELHSGPIPDGLWVLHKCDNPKCVNPEHLFLGTAQDNLGDMRMKGRDARGASHGVARFNDVSVREIRAAYATGVGIHALSRRLACSPTTIFNIVHRLTWRHVA